MSLVSEATQLIGFIRKTSKEAAIQEAVNDLQIKIGDLAQERIELIDTVSDLKAKIAELEEAAAEAERQKAKLDQYKPGTLPGNVPCYIHQDEKDAYSASKRYCPQCYESGRLHQLSGIADMHMVAVNCAQCRWSGTHM
ncbi:hypothetical protein A8U91_01295 [Halomonas elongata]|uniref:Uncharacterized protein n=1 Tax=Halomonas elongata TaxID=2746 RepID=A0A1B8P3Y6_HALEL|nr:hypothetical protein [Halomonas elongata]OBX36947.1 hypothetical protein A8U91_01295 [Halomonas elongata]